MVRLYIIRHAEAMGNINETFQGHSDLELSPKGKLQLECLKERFRDISFDAIYSSPLIRAMDTARAANFYHNLEIIEEPGLIEVNGGVFEGKKWSDLPKLYPVAYNLWANDFANFDVEQGESVRHVYSRMVETIEKIARENEGKTVVAVSHGCAIKCYLCYALGIPLEQVNEVGWADNTAVSLLEFDENYKPTVIFRNNSDHLTEELSTLATQKWWRTEESK